MTPVLLWMALLAAEPMTLVVGRGAVVDCPAGVARVSTSNPEAVDTVLASESEVLFQAKVGRAGDAGGVVEGG